MNAVKNTVGLEHAAIVHDPFHVMKLAGAMLDELRREVFFRADPDLRAIGQGQSLAPPPRLGADLG